MQKYFNSSLFFIFFALLFMQGAVEGASNVQFLKNRLTPEDKRYATFLKTMDLLSEREASVIVETGTCRFGEQGYIGDGGFTIIFGDWASKNAATLYSVDHDSNAIAVAKAVTKPFGSSIQFRKADSVNFLKGFDGIIDLLYVDSEEYDMKNPKKSQELALKEVVAAYPHFHNRSIIVIDDHALEGGGRGKLAIKFLQEHGCKIISQGYQVVMSWQ